MAQNINELIFYFLIIIKIIQRILHLTLTINIKYSLENHLELHGHGNVPILDVFLFAHTCLLFKLIRNACMTLMTNFGFSPS